MRRFLPLALAALLALTLLPGLRAVDALDVREARDLEVARETLTEHGQLEPVYAHDVDFEKPLAGIGHELATRLALRALAPGRVAELRVPASRAVRAALAALLALLVAVVGTRAFGARAGWLAGCAFVTTAGLPLAARTDGTQLLATTCAWLGIGALLAVVRGGARAPGLTRFGAWLAFGAAGVIGGPLPALWPLAGFALYFTLARSRAGWREVRPLAGLAIVTGMALPWYGLMTALHGGAFLARVPWFPYALEPRSGLGASLATLAFPLIAGFPWSPLLGASLRDAAQRLRRAAAPADLHESGHAASLMLCLLVAASASLVFYPSAPLTAALPALPAVALLCGRFLDRVLDGDVDARLLALSVRVAAALGTLLAVLAAALAPRLPEAAPGLRALGAVLLATAWAPALADLAGRRRLAGALLALPVALGAPLAETRVLPPLEPWFDTRAVADAIGRDMPGHAPLVLFDAPPPSLRLNVRHNLVVLPGPSAPLLDDAAPDGYAYLAFAPSREHAIAHAMPAPLEVLLRTPALAFARVAVAPPALPRPATAPAGP